MSKNTQEFKPGFDTIGVSQLAVVRSAKISGGRIWARSSCTLFDLGPATQRIGSGIRVSNSQPASQLEILLMALQCWNPHKLNAELFSWKVEWFHVLGICST